MLALSPSLRTNAFAGGIGLLDVCFATAGAGASWLGIWCFCSETCSTWCRCWTSSTFTCGVGGAVYAGLGVKQLANPMIRLGNQERHTSCGGGASLEPATDVRTHTGAQRSQHSLQTMSQEPVRCVCCLRILGGPLDQLLSVYREGPSGTLS